jgi:hypothetical protein
MISLDQVSSDNFVGVPLHDMSQFNVQPIVISYVNKKSLNWKTCLTEAMSYTCLMMPEIQLISKFFLFVKILILFICRSLIISRNRKQCLA